MLCAVYHQTGRKLINSATGTQTRDARVRAEYPNQLDYSGFCWVQEGPTLPQNSCVLSQQGHAGTDDPIRCMASYRRDQDEEF